MLLFIAPVSAFNQTLTEDRGVNRLVRLCVSEWATVHDLIRDPVGFVPFVEVAMRTQVVERGDFCFAA
jgi:hypothetical protein